jgi:branched-subunit amino acid aminotransferase/4-amino-4-deoxychorismate lyase
VITEVLINGARSDGKIPVTDSSVLRGDGCFEVLKSYGGRPFALYEHLERLESSAAKLGIPLPPRAEIAQWIEKVSSDVGDGAVRVVVTRGSSLPGLDDPANVIVFAHTWERLPARGRLLPVEAPWHAAGVDWDLSGVKAISYAPNMAAIRRAQAEGFDDALLMTTDGVVLEGPTFAIGWVVDGVLQTPALDLGILDSITRRVVMDIAAELGIEVVEGRWHLDRLGDASEVTAWSTILEIQAVIAIGERTWEPGPVTSRLSKAFAERVALGTGTH